MNKRQLAVLLSKIKTFQEQDVKLEQYPTDAEIAADVLWAAFLSKDIENKTIADLGCGHGIFGLGCLILGAKKVFFVDIDKKAISVAKENLKAVEKEIGNKLKANFFNIDVKDFSKKAEVIIQNPPFGVKTTHMDKLFLLKAMELSPVVYSFHKMSTEEFVKAVARDNGFDIVSKWAYKFPLKRSFWFHIKRVHHVDVGCWKMVRSK